VWELNHENDNLESFLLYVQKMGRQLFKPAFGIQFNMRLPLDIPMKPMTSFKRRQLVLTLKECFNNSIKHAAASSVNLVIHLGDDLVLEVVDNGKGFDLNEQQSRGNGLKNLDYRMEQVAGSVSIVSNQHGTSIRLVIPLNE
jgi:signal transduction histidine kinase